MTSGTNTMVDEKTSRNSSDSITKASIAGTGGAEKADVKERAISADAAGAAAPAGAMNEKSVVGADAGAEDSDAATKGDAAAGAEPEVEIIYPSPAKLALLTIGLALVIFVVSCSSWRFCTMIWVLSSAKSRLRLIIPSLVSCNQRFRVRGLNWTCSDRHSDDHDGVRLVE